MITVQTISTITTTLVDNLEVKNQAMAPPLSSSHKKNKNQKKKRQSNVKSTSHAKEIAKEIAFNEPNIHKIQENLIQIKSTHREQISHHHIAESEPKNEHSNYQFNARHTKDKVVYIRKNPQNEDNVPKQEGNNCQPSIQKQDSSEEVKQPEKVHSSSSKKINSVEKKKIQEIKDQSTFAIKSPTKIVKIDQQCSQEDITRLDVKIEDRISLESRKEAESCEDILKIGDYNSTQPITKSQSSQSATKNKDLLKGNVFYTPQKKLKKKQEIQQYYYHQFIKKNGNNTQHYHEEQLGVNRNFTQSPSFTRQKENEEDVKKRRQEDRLKMLLEILNPSSVTILSYLDMGCGNCEISAEIGKIYGVKHIYGCDIYSEDQFVRPADTPSSTLFTYITNRSDSLQPLKDKSLDLITCFMVLHHIENLDQNLRELQRVIKDGGYLYIREHDVPEDNKELDQYLRYKHERFDDCGQFMKFWGKNDLIDKLSRYGFIHSGDSLYSDNRPNRQKVYHSLFKFSIQHFNKMEEQNNIHLLLPNNTKYPSQQTHSKNSKKKSNSKCPEREKKEISVSNFILSSDSSEQTVKQQESIDNGEILDLHIQSDKQSSINNQANNIFKTNSTSSTATPNTITTSSSEDSTSKQKNPYKIQFDELKESNDRHKNRKQSPLVWRNNSKKESSQDNSEDNQNNEYNNNIFNNFHHHHYQYHHHHHHHHHTKSANYQSGFNQRINKNNLFQDNQSKNSNNPNYRFKSDKNEYQFTQKKHRKSQEYEFDDDDEEFSTTKKQKDEYRTHHNHIPQVQPVQRNQKAPLNQSKPVKLIDILS